MGIIWFPQLKKLFVKKKSLIQIDDDKFYKKWGIKVKHVKKRYSYEEKIDFATNGGQVRRYSDWRRFLFMEDYWYRYDIHWFTPTYQDCTIVNRYYYVGILAYCFFFTGSYLNTTYDYSNHVDEANGYEGIGLIFGTTEHETEDFKDIIGYDIDSYREFALPRTIYYYGCKEYVSRCKQVKKMFCKEKGLVYSWDITYEDYAKQGAHGRSLCLDFKSYPPAEYMTWYRDLIQKTERIQNSLIEKRKLYLKQNLPLDETLNPAEEFYYYNLALKKEDTKLKKQLLGQIYCLKCHDKQILVKYVFFWQARWYNMVGLEDLIVKDMTLDEITQRFVRVSKIKLRKIITGYIKLYRRDVKIWEAKEKFEIYYNGTYGSLKPLSLAESPFENEVYVDWLNFYEGNFIARTKLLIPRVTPERRAREYHTVNERKHTIERQYLDGKLEVNAFERFMYSGLAGYDFQLYPDYEAFEAYVQKRKYFDLKNIRKKYKASDFEVEKTIVDIKHAEQDIILKRSDDLHMDLKKNKDWNIEKLREEYDRLQTMEDDLMDEEETYKLYSTYIKEALPNFDIEKRLKEIEKKKKKPQ